ncbi:hypothetical protein MPPM_4778 [Methylorubrum populi]|uniref:Uncharacterized protein n=1 Tax=Methylorubrum populi TaxID=223967 RepID=A0A160PL46_9HYPH|nr:hypothetical protein [Methylorubrum populi]BAU93383.1 hypothetical protein MPPM_4778 [Methylorubrum populi]
MRYVLTLTALIALIASPASPQSQQDKGALKRFAVSEIYHGPPVFPDFRGRDRGFNLYRTRIRAGISSGPNFSGTYSLISFGCGTGCTQVYIADNRNGYVGNVPIGGEETPYLQMFYNINSSAIIAYWQYGGRCVRKVLALVDRNFNEYQQSEIGPEEACYNIGDASNLQSVQRALGGKEEPSNLPDIAPATPASAHSDREANLNQQAGFIAAVKHARTEYAQGQNDMAKGAARPMRAKNVCAALKGYSVSGWIGKISKLSSNSEGKGVLHIEISPQITLKTWNNALSDISDGTLIEAGSKVFRQASALREGADIQFSGSFIPSSIDCVKEGSLTLSGSIERPEYLFRFSDVSPI